MERVLKRYGWVATALAIVAIAYFVAMTLGEFILKKLGAGVDLAQLGPPRISADGGSIEGYGTPAREVTMDDLLAGNLFEVPEAEPEPALVVEAEPEPEVESAPGPGDGIIRPCPIPLHLVALVAGPPSAPETGFATIAREGRTAEYRVGYDVGGFILNRITWNRVYLTQTAGGPECFSDIRHPGLVGAATDVPPAVKPPEPSAQAIVAQAPNPESMSREERFRRAVETSITTVSDTERTVQRSLINTVLDNQDIAMRQARVMPHEDGGEIVGFKVYGIRRDSLFGSLGLENGDLIESVNGIPMTGADKALQAYGRLRMADRISITLNRRGQRVTLDYNVR